MGKVIVTTGYDDNFAEIGDLTTHGKRLYAKKFGYDFSCKRIYKEDTHPSWQKIEHVIQLLASHETVIWLDADTVITNPNFDIIAECKPGLNVSRDWNNNHPFANMSLGNFVTTRDALQIWLLASSLYEWANKFDWDQGAVRRVYENNPDIRNLFHIHPRRLFNAVDSRIRPNVIEPWQPGDWLTHLTADDMGSRVRIAREFVYPAKEYKPKLTELKFSHGGALGDIVYHLPIVKQLGGGEFYVIPNNGKGYQTENDMQYRVIRPLLEIQSYITKTGWVNIPVGICFDGWRNMLDFSKNLTDQACKWIGLPPIPTDGPPWLENVESLKIAEVVISRATRNLFPGFPWKNLLDRYKGKCVFLGLPYEYKAFIAEHGYLPFYPTENYLVAAQVIKGANLFAGSASGLLAVAEGLKQNCIASSFPLISHCVFYQRPGHQHCWETLHLDKYDDEGRLIK